MSVQGGLGYQTKDIGGDSENNGVAWWILRFRQDFIGNDLETFHNHSIVTRVSGRSHTVIDTETGVNYDISDLRCAKLSPKYDYEIEPTDDAENQDLSVVVGIGLEFQF